MAREPGYGELTGRLDDLENELDSLRKAVLVFVIVGVILWLDVRQSKGGKDVD